MSHLLVAVRFPPTREGSGTKSSGRRPKNRAILQVSTSVFGTQPGIAVLIYLWDVLGLRFLAPPAVTSAIGVLTQAFVKIEVESCMGACRIVLQNRNLDVPIPRVRWYLEVIQLTLQERISERIVVQIVVVSVPQFQEQIVEIVIILSGAVSAAHWGQIVDFPVPQVVGRNRGRDSLRFGSLLFPQKSTPSKLGIAVLIGIFWDFGLLQP